MTEVVAVLIWDKEKFMICQRPSHKAWGLLWEFVGSKVEPSETKQGVQGETGRHIVRGGRVHECDPCIPGPDSASDSVFRHHQGRRVPKAGTQRHPLNHCGRDQTV